MTERSSPIADDETERLISSSKVEGTAVYDTAGDKLGTIKNFMVEKRTGHAEYAVLSTAGMFGGGRLYPIPWPELRYDTDRGGYVVDLSKERLEGAPHYEEASEPRYDADYDERVRGYYRR